jgi:putative spermidine/putrescine transport system ATP-binding protein
MVRLEGKGERYPSQLSGGQQQRVALARALVFEPRLVLMDEPLSALDKKLREQMQVELRGLQQAVGITFVLVTHDQEEALGISDRIGVMSEGRLEQVGTPTEIYRNPASAFVARFVGSMNQLPATVTGNDRVEIAGVTVPTWAAATFGLGQAVTLLVRPEDVEVTALGPNGLGPEGGLTGSVVGRTFAGAATLVQVRADRLDVLLTAHAASSRADGLGPGARVGISVDGGRALCEIPEAAPAVTVEV